MISRIISAMRLWATRKVKGGKCCKLAWSTRIITGIGGRIETGNYLVVCRNSTVHAEKGVIQFGNGCFINEGTLIVSHEKIVVGNRVKIGPHVCIYDHDHDTVNLNSYKTAPVEIGNDVWIGAGAIILRGSKIGDGAVVAAGTVVRGEVPPRTVVYDKRNCMFKKI